MLRDDGSVKVLDFGLAKMTGPEAEEALGSDVSTQARTREGAVMGTLPYMAPEQISGRPVDHRSDIFSLGVLLYEMATGRRPFEGQSSAELGSAILRDTPPPPSELRGDLREALSRVIARCLEKDPDSRFQSVRALLGALREAAAVGGGSGATGTERPAPRAVKLAGGITVVLAAVAVLFLFLRGEDPREGTAVRTPEVDTSTAGAAARPSVAVLPFANLSGDPEQEYFSDGIAEEVLNALASVPGLRVAARSSAFSFKGRSVDARTIGEQLNVAHVLEGSVRKSGSRLRITAQLVSASDGYQLWNQVFDREMTDVFAIQEEIARAIVRALSAQLGVELAGAPLVQPGTSNLEAYNAYLRRWFRLGTYSLEATEQSIQDFGQAIAADPEFADAHGALAMAWANLHIWVPFDDVDRPLEEAFIRALALDPHEPGALAGKAWHTVRTTWDWRAAEELYLRGIGRDARDVFALDFYAALQLSPTGRTDEAVAVYRRALENDPFNTLLGWDLAWVLMMGGRAEEALVEVDGVLSATPDYPWGHALRAWALAESGRDERVRAALARVPESDDELVLFTRVVAHHALGEDGAVVRLTGRLRTLATSSRVKSLWLAWALLRTDHVEEGLQELEQALDVGSFQIPMSRTLFARSPAVRAHPRFQALLKRMRLDDASLREQGFET
jgi:serine/threonine-protein kinase